MASKEVKFSTDARNKMLDGVDILQHPLYTLLFWDQSRKTSRHTLQILLVGPYPCRKEDGIETSFTPSRKVNMTLISN